MATPRSLRVCYTGLVIGGNIVGVADGSWGVIKTRFQ